jgi:hypothetical protein
MSGLWPTRIARLECRSCYCLERAGRRRARNTLRSGENSPALVDGQPLPTGHYMQEEAPDQFYDHFVKFFTA